MCAFDVFNCKYCVYRLYILHVVQPADITLQVFFICSPVFNGQGVGRHLSPLQGRSLLPWSADLPSSHHASSARGHLEMHVRTDEV